MRKEKNGGLYKLENWLKHLTIFNLPIKWITSSLECPGQGIWTPSHKRAYIEAMFTPDGTGGWWYIWKIFINKVWKAHDIFKTQNNSEGLWRRKVVVVSNIFLSFFFYIRKRRKESNHRGCNCYIQMNSRFDFYYNW